MKNLEAELLDLHSESLNGLAVSSRVFQVDMTLRLSAQRVYDLRRIAQLSGESVSSLAERLLTAAVDDAREVFKLPSYDDEMDTADAHEEALASARKKRPNRRSSLQSA